MVLVDDPDAGNEQTRQQVMVPVEIKFQYRLLQRDLPSTSVYFRVFQLKFGEERDLRIEPITDEENVACEIGLRCSVVSMICILAGRIR